MRKQLIHGFSLAVTAVALTAVSLRAALALGWISGNPIHSALGPYVAIAGPVAAIVIFGATIVCAMDAYRCRLGWWLVFLIFGSIPAVVFYYWFRYRPSEVRGKTIRDIKASV